MIRLHLSGKSVKCNPHGYSGKRQHVHYADPKFVAEKLRHGYVALPPSFKAMTIMGSWV